MKSQDKIKALNIIYMHWIKPSLNIKLNALKKIQRFCRRGSGAHTHHSMICKKADFGQMFAPPVLYRQVCNCPKGLCAKIPIRIYNKNKRMQYAIKKIYEKDGELNFDYRSTSWSLERQKSLNYKYYTSIEHCYCNNKPFGSYQLMVSHPRGNFTAKDGIRYIMCELSGDQLTYYTRFKLSQYLTNRLR